MKTLSKIYSDKETRNGIAVNKTYLVPVEQIYLEPGYNIHEADEQHVEYSRSAGNQVSHYRH